MVNKNKSKKKKHQNESQKYIGRTDNKTGGDGKVEMNKGSQKYIDDKKKRYDDKIEKERTDEFNKELEKYISRDYKMKGDGNKVEINKEMAAQAITLKINRNRKLIEMKLRGVDEEHTDANDKLLSYFQMRKYLRAMRRFKCLVYFYHGSDEEHPLYNDKDTTVHHMYYDVDTPEIIANNFKKLMHVHHILKNKPDRDKLFQKQEAERLELLKKLEAETSLAMEE